MTKPKPKGGIRTRINVLSVLNTEGAHQETLNGRQVMVVQSATMPDNVVMNEILYPADEIHWSYHTLNRTPAPLGHPTIDGVFVSASDPEGINIGYIGAWNDNAEQRDGRVFLDKLIDIEIASQSDKGRKVLAAIKKGKPIHTSTGLLCNLEEVNNPDYRFIARNLYFDHDAILLTDQGAATPAQGVGMMVNDKDERIDINVINSSAVKQLGNDIKWSAGNSPIEKEEGRNAFFNYLRSCLQPLWDMEQGKTLNQGDDKMSVEQKDVDDLAERVNALSEKFDKTVDGLSDIVSNAVKAAIEPVQKSVDTMQANADEKANAEKGALIEKVVANKLLNQEEADDATLSTLKALANTIKPKAAAPIFGGFIPAANENATDQWANYSLNDCKDIKEAS